ncbi:MAG: WXG100 family type VII secretion target [Actinomadura sp.]
MSDGFAINSGELRGSGRELQRLAEQLSNRQGDLNAQVTGSSAVWGADEEGTAFGVAYQEIVGKVQELLGAMAEAFDTVGANLSLTADNFDAAEEANTAQLAAIMERLEAGP